MSTFSAVSTPARNIASGLAARIFCICGIAVVAPRGTTSSATTWMPAFSSAPLKPCAIAWPRSELSVISATRLKFLLRGVREQRGDLRRAERPGLPEVRVVELRRQVVGRIHRRHLRRLRLHGHGLLLLRGRAERDAEDEHHALVDELARERRRDVGPRLVVLDQQLDLAAEHAALAVDLLAPKTTPSVAGSEYGLETPTRSVITPILMVSCANAIPA